MDKHEIKNKKNSIVLCIYKKHFSIVISTHILKSKYFPNTECIQRLTAREGSQEAY